MDKTLGTRRTVTLTLAGAALLGAATFGALRFHHAPGAAPPAAAHARVAEASSAEQEGPDGGPSLPGRRWEPGESFVYEVSTEGSASVETTGRPAQSSSAKLSGTLALTVIARSGAGFTVRGDLRHGSLQQDKKTFGATDLAAPFYAAASPQGELSSFRFSRRLPVEARTALESLVASLQLVAPPRPSASWQTREIDTTGLYEASYRLDGGAVHKTKGRYVGTKDANGISPLSTGTVISVQGATDFDVDASGWPRKMAETEAMSMSWAEGIKISGSTRTRAALTGVEARPDLVADGVESDVTRETRDRAQARVESDRQVVGGKDFKDLAAAVRAKDTGTRNHTQAQLAALFRLDPKAAEAGEDAILHGDMDDNAKKRMSAALGTAGTPEAQHALASVLGTQDAPAARRMDAAIGLAQVNSPTAEAAEALDQAMASPGPGVASTATLASGALVNKTNTEAGNSLDLAQTKDAVEKLILGLTTATSDQQRLVFLQALGNTGDLRAWPAIQPYLLGPRTTLRAAAAFSLRFMAGDAIDAAIAAAFTDADMGVRRAAVSTISYRSNLLPLLPALDAVMKGDPETSVRIAVIDGLKMKLGQDESVVELVKWAAEHDPAAEVRNLARKVLAPAGS